MLSFKCVNDVYCRGRIKILNHVFENGDKWGGVWKNFLKRKLFLYFLKKSPESFSYIFSKKAPCTFRPRPLKFFPKKSALKKFLIFSQKKPLIFWKRKPWKILIFQETELSYTSRSNFPRIKNVLYFFL